MFQSLAACAIGGVSLFGGRGRVAFVVLDALFIALLSNGLNLIRMGAYLQQFVFSRFTTINRTICGDQVPGSLIARIYEWQPLIDFLAAAMDKPRLYPMADPLGRINVMCYRAGERLNWHFDRVEFTTTMLLQAPVSGGEFQYRSGLRSDTDPNYDGVARLPAGEDGTLNVFRGKNTAHRVTTVEGGHARIIAVFSYNEAADVAFSDAERLGFCGRTG